jgi:exopolyphosphatase/guanosine-5'-triphosphate,3'-diphosphate pyrophosphatase
VGLIPRVSPGQKGPRVSARPWNTCGVSDLPGVVPRWEWRAFAESFGPVESRFDSLSPERVGESDDLYLLSPDSDASVKVRAGIMDVKRLERVDGDGLEQWMPVLKAPFPMSAADVGFVLESLRASAPQLERAAYSLDELAEALAHASPQIVFADVHKRREHYTIGGCTAERARMRTPAGATRTIAVESEDPDRVAAAVRELGFTPRRNVSVARGLKALLGFGARRYAVIDVGTNSVKFHLGERRADGAWRTVVDRAEVTRLGEGLQETGRLGAAPMERSVAAIAAMADEAGRDGAEAIAAVGTAGLRLAPNAAEFVDAVRARCRLEIEIIPTEEERRLAFLAATAGLGPISGSLVVFDTGGGSSQFTFSEGERFSVNVGAVRYTERYDLDGVTSEETLAEALTAIARDLVRLQGRRAPDALVGMGGAVTNLAAVRHEIAAYDPDVVQGTVLDRGEIDRQIEIYRARTAEQRRRIAGLQPNRAAVILAGACIVRTVMTLLGRESLIVSDRGLRHGLLVERFGQ